MYCHYPEYAILTVHTSLSGVFVGGAITSLRVIGDLAEHSYERPRIAAVRRPFVVRPLATTP